MDSWKGMGEAYAESFGMDAAREMREAQANPCVRVVRKRRPDLPLETGLTRMTEGDLKVSRPNLVGDIVEKTVVVDMGFFPKVAAGDILTTRGDVFAKKCSNSVEENGISDGPPSKLSFSTTLDQDMMIPLSQTPGSRGVTNIKDAKSKEDTRSKGDTMNQGAMEYKGAMENKGEVENKWRVDKTQISAGDGICPDISIGDPTGDPTGDFKAKNTVQFVVDESELTKKLAWTNEVNYGEKDVFESEIGELRFDFDGQLVSPYCNDIGVGLNGAVNGDILGLHNHGAMGHLPGYSLPEITTLLSSKFDAQVLVALRICKRVFENRYLANQKRYKINYIGLAEEVRRERIRHHSQEGQETIHGETSHRASSNSYGGVDRDYMRFNRPDLIEELTDNSSSGFSFGFGLKRFNDYLYRFSMIHEKLLYLIFNGATLQIVDLAVIALAALITHTTVPVLEEITLSYNHALWFALPNCDNESIARHFLTSRRSVLRRENFTELIVTNGRSDFSEELKLLIIGEDSGEKEKEASQEIELEHRRTDPLLSILLWGEKGIHPDVIKILISRIALSVNADVAPAGLRLMTVLTMHSSFAANLLYQYIKDHRDARDRTCVRTLLDGLEETIYRREVPTNTHDGVVHEQLLALLAFIRVASLATGSPVNDLLVANGDRKTVDGHVWRLLLNYFEHETNLDDALVCLDLVNDTENEIDGECSLLSIYEPMLSFFDKVIVSRRSELDVQGRFKVALVFSKLIDCCLERRKERSASLHSLLMRYLVLYIPVLFQRTCNPDEVCSVLHLAESMALARCLHLVNSAQDFCRDTKQAADTASGAHEASIYDVDKHGMMLESLIEAVQESVKQVLSWRFHSDKICRELDDGAHAMNLMDFNPIVAIRPDGVPRALIMSWQVEIVAQTAHLLEVYGSEQLGLPFSSKLSFVEKLLGGNSVAGLAVDISRCIYDYAVHLVSFPRRPRKGINTSDLDCFALTNPLMDTWGRASGIMLKYLPDNEKSRTAYASLACPFKLSTANELRRSLPPIVDDDWLTHLALCCGFCYEESTDEVDAQVDITKSSLLSTAMIFLFGNLFVSSRLQHLGSQYSDSINEIGHRSLIRCTDIAVTLKLCHVWLYEFLEMMTKTDMNVKWDLLERLHTRVLQHFAPSESTTDQSLAITSGHSSLISKLMLEWNDTYVHNIKSRMVEELQTAVVNDRISPRLRLAWLWLLNNSALQPSIKRVWLSESTLNICHKCFGENFGGFDRRWFRYVANLSCDAELNPMVEKWLQTVISAGDTQNSIVRDIAIATRKQGGAKAGIGGMAGAVVQAYYGRRQ